jgi:hypothetical protein
LRLRPNRYRDGSRKRSVSQMKLKTANRRVVSLRGPFHFQRFKPASKPWVLRGGLQENIWPHNFTADEA